MNNRKFGELVITVTLGFVVCGLLSSCSSFQRSWREAAATGALPPGDDIFGRWEGTWKSDSSGHNDKLRCVISKVDSEHYTAKFHAKYKHIFSFGYSVPLVVTNDGTKRTFKGEADLGKLAGGLYTYEGSANPTNFYSRYDSKYDHGTFQMTRPLK